MLSSTFDIFSKVILEKNYSYSIPQDKELILYDFYMLVHLNALKKEGKFHPGDKKDHFGQVSQTTTHSMGLDHSTEFSFEEIKKQLIGYLQPELLEASLFSISCELRHVFDSNTPLNITATLGPKIAEFYTNLKYNYEKLKSLSAIKKNADSTIKDLINKRRRKFNKKYNIKMKEDGASRNTDYRLSYKALKQTITKLNISEVEVAEIGRKSFLSLNWSSSYGGKPWASICDAYIKLYYAKREVDQIIYIDNMYHQQHNTDTVFNKLQSYYKSNAGYRWVLNALNFKADVKDNWDRIKKIKEVATIKIKDASGNVTKEVPALRSIDRMYIEMLKASGDRTWEQYYKVEKSPPKEEPKEHLYDIQNSIPFSASKYLPPKSSYQEIPLHSASTSADHLNILKSRSHWNKMAKEGFKKFGKIYNSSGNELIAVGPGVNTSPYLLGQLNIASSDLFMLLDSGKWSSSNEGSSPAHDYAIPKDIWIKKFGEPKPTSKKESVITPEVIKKYQNLAKLGQKKSNDNMVVHYNILHVGHGTSVLEDMNKGIFTPDMLEDAVFGLWNASGWAAIPDKSMLKHISDVWMKNHAWVELFGHIKDLIDSTTSDISPEIKRKFKKLAKITNALPYLKDNKTKDGEQLIYIGKGSLRETGFPIQSVKRVDTYGGTSGASEFSNNMLGTNKSYHYFITAKKWKEVFGEEPPVKTKKDDSTTNNKVSQRILTKFINLAKEGYKMGNNVAVDGTPLIYVGKGKLSESGILSSTLSSVIKGGIYSNSNNSTNKKTSGWLGSDKYKDYFITARKWQEVFGEEPPTQTEETDSESKNKTPQQILKKFENLAVEGYKKGYYKNHYGHNLVYVGKGPIGTEANGFPDITIPHDIYAISPDTKEVDGIYILSGGWSGDNRKKDYFITETDWTEIFGVHPPADIYV